MWEKKTILDKSKNTWSINSYLGNNTNVARLKSIFLLKSIK